MNLNKKILCIVFLSIMFFAFAVLHFICSNIGEQVVTKVNSPVDFILDDNRLFKFESVKTFDCDYTENNIKLSKLLNMTEDEAFTFGCFGKYWAKNILEGRRIKISENDLIYYKFGYMTRLKNSSFSFSDTKPMNEQAFIRQLKMIRKEK